MRPHQRPLGLGVRLLGRRGVVHGLDVGDGGAELRPPVQRLARQRRAAQRVHQLQRRQQRRRVHLRSGQRLLLVGLAMF